MSGTSAYEASFVLLDFGERPPTMDRRTLAKAGNQELNGVLWRRPAETYAANAVETYEEGARIAERIVRRSTLVRLAGRETVTLELRQPLVQSSLQLRCHWLRVHVYAAGLSETGCVLGTDEKDVV
jgi:hypothetical protein